ncbi:outer membrane protein [Parabacteroides sp. PF5-5]|uniref:TolC family protein n=1 Tax=unclassified Parabacteroides TaxID=2649774 RepID=UPI0024735586|nr:MULTISPECIES: TolC family protein [unclassified Parabacteroides]MDH6304797.1 outer membrane protein [Parabacteroides sp. PH5-39]MDH6315588.1 outer membrane protein [Parabacteroides sp. PF5-13]MDH6319249.1 outer membrane protein [Parabacteroides sp. PH5-13]MDH6322980.1 outer membrane protein [Parabacteroides sp. PH5-8]MDH6326781.1 outer membrane protein [Parabacteroides sp. PH5-41]
MKRLGFSKKRMLAVLVMLPSLAFTTIRAQEQPLVLDLEKALEIAMSESPTIQVANQEIEKKKFAKKGAYAALFPQVTFGFDYSRTLKKQVMYMDGDAFNIADMLTPVMDPIIKGADQTLQDIVPGYKPGSLQDHINANTPPPAESSGGNDGISVGRDNNWSLGFNAAMPLINASLWKSIAITGQDVELAVEQARSSKIDLTNQVTKAFYSVLLANDSYQVFKESYDNAMKNYVDIKQKYEQGLVAEYDLIRADVAVRNAEPNMLQAENSVKLVKWQLKALLGVDLDLPLECEGKLTNYQSELFGDFLTTTTDTALTDNTSLKQLDIQQGQLVNTLKMQKFDFLPTLSLTGLYNWSSMNNDFKFKDYQWNPYSMIGISLSIPIFSGGSKIQKVNQTKVMMTQLDLQRDDLKRNLQLAVRQSLDNMNTCVKRFDAAQKGVEQAQRGYMISQKRYDTGAGTLLEMNDAELAMTQAKLNFNQAIYDYMTAKSDLEKTLGKQAN